MTYGEQEWREATQACLDRMELYDDTSEHAGHAEHAEHAALN